MKLCAFCAGAGWHFFIRCERPAWWFCQPCAGTGTTTTRGPAELRIGRSQSRFLKPYPESTS